MSLKSAKKGSHYFVVDLLEVKLLTHTYNVPTGVYIHIHFSSFK